MTKSICSTCGIELITYWRYCPKCGGATPPPVNEDETTYKYNIAKIRCAKCKKARNDLWVSYPDGKSESLSPIYCFVCGSELEIVETIGLESPPLSPKCFRILRGQAELKMAVSPDVVAEIRKEFAGDTRIVAIKGPFGYKEGYFTLEVNEGVYIQEIKDEVMGFLGL